MASYKIEVFKDLAAGLARSIGFIIGSPIIIPVGLLVMLSNEFNKRFNGDPFVVSIHKVHGEMAKLNSSLEDRKLNLQESYRILEEVEKGSKQGNIELLRLKVKSLEEEIELIEDKLVTLNLALMIRERKELLEKHLGKGIWSKIAKCPSKVYDQKVGEVLKKYEEERLNMKVFKDYFLSSMETMKQ